MYERSAATPVEALLAVGGNDPRTTGFLRHHGAAEAPTLEALVASRHRVVTVDREDFRVYRRNRRKAIPLICPP